MAKQELKSAMMKTAKQLNYYLCDVFTEHQFGGNPLAVFPDVEGLKTELMQNIAREFNFSETTFVFPATGKGDKLVRIFTPTREVPFAGHPNVGTAFVLDYLAQQQGEATASPFVFEEKAGLVHVERRTFSSGAEGYYLQAPESFITGINIPTQAVAEALSLQLDDICEHHHNPIVASSGLPFVVVQLNSFAALRGVKLNLTGFEKIHQLGVEPDVLAYVKQDDDNQIRCRMFAPFDGVNEDPATGSANCALAGLLASVDSASHGEFHFSIRQGVEMGRPSALFSQATKRDGKVISTGVAGSAVIFSQGTVLVNLNSG